jgi:hypothetical protein
LVEKLSQNLVEKLSQILGKGKGKGNKRETERETKGNGTKRKETQKRCFLEKRRGHH